MFIEISVFAKIFTIDVGKLLIKMLLSQNNVKILFVLLYLKKIKFFKFFYKTKVCTSKISFQLDNYIVQSTK